MIRLFAGAFVAAIAMFVTGFIFYATPLQYVAAGRVSDAQSAALQSSLAANLPATGTYMIPDTTTATGTIAYGKGPVATVHYNTGGFSLADTNVLIAGFIHEFIVCLLIAGALSVHARRTTDFAAHAQNAVLFSLAGATLLRLGEPIWYHHDWPFFIYRFVADATMLIVASLIIARWFLPKLSQQVEHPGGSGEVGTA